MGVLVLSIVLGFTLGYLWSYLDGPDENGKKSTQFSHLKRACVIAAYFGITIVVLAGLEGLGLL